MDFFNFNFFFWYISYSYVKVCENHLYEYSIHKQFLRESNYVFYVRDFSGNNMQKSPLICDRWTLITENFNGFWLASTDDRFIYCTGRFVFSWFVHIWLFSFHFRILHVNVECKWQDRYNYLVPNQPREVSNYLPSFPSMGRDEGSIKLSKSYLCFI